MNNDIIKETTNPLAHLTRRFEESIEQIDFEKAKDLNSLFAVLSQIKLRDGYSLGGFLCGDVDFGATYRLYAFRTGSIEQYVPGEVGVHLEPRMPEIGDIYSDNEPTQRRNYELAPYNDSMFIVGTISHEAEETVPPLSDYLKFEFTPEAIWEAVLLLREAEGYLPHFWHGGYAHRRFVVDDYSLAFNSIRRVDKDLWTQFLSDSRIAPSVTLLSASSAQVHYCMWSNWTGLYSVDLLATRVGSSLNFEVLRKEVLLPYDCGMKF